MSDVTIIANNFNPEVETTSYMFKVDFGGLEPKSVTIKAVANEEAKLEVEFYSHPGGDNVTAINNNDGLTTYSKAFHITYCDIHVVGAEQIGGELQTKMPKVLSISDMQLNDIRTMKK